MTYVDVLALVVALAGPDGRARGAAGRPEGGAGRARRARGPRAPDDVDWQLQWIEPGVYFLANTSPGSAALQVEVSSSLTPVAGGAATTATAHARG